MNDKIIRVSLIKKLKLEFPDTNGERNLIVNEMALCRGIARADIAVVNGSLHGYEIKSSEDNLNRLDHQLEIYSKCFDYISVVTTEKHLSHVYAACPRTIGIAEAKIVKGSVHIVNRRLPKRNKQVDALSILELLWKDETLKLAARLNLSEGLKGKSKKLIWQHIASNASLRAIQDLIRDILKSRQGWRSDLALT